MKRQYLHLSVYRCEECTGPVIAGWLGVRENAISKETLIRQVGAICISCGHRQQNTTGTTEATRHFPPMEWEPEGATGSHTQTTTLLEGLDRADLH